MEVTVPRRKKECFLPEFSNCIIAIHHQWLNETETGEGKFKAKRERRRKKPYHQRLRYAGEDPMKGGPPPPRAIANKQKTTQAIELRTGSQMSILR